MQHSRRSFLTRATLGVAAIGTVAWPALLSAQQNHELHPDPTIPSLVTYPGGFAVRTFVQWDGSQKLSYFYLELPAADPLKNRYRTNLMDMFRAIGLIRSGPLAPSLDIQLVGEPFVKIVEWSGLMLAGAFTVGVNYLWPQGTEIDVASIMVGPTDQIFIANAPGFPSLEILSRAEEGSGRGHDLLHHR